LAEGDELKIRLARGTRVGRLPRLGQTQRRPCVAWRLLEQSSRQRALCVPQQEQSRQPEQEHRFSGGGVHILQAERRPGRASLPELPGGRNLLLPGRGEEWRSLLQAAFGVSSSRRNNNGPAPWAQPWRGARSSGNACGPFESR
jgi:hypothetical protein